MDTFTFKTDIDSSEAVATVRKLLDNDKKIQYWHVDFLKEDHLLTITGTDLKAEEIKQILKEAGFEIEEVGQAQK
jgi:Uri superfamily endonuclease